MEKFNIVIITENETLLICIGQREFSENEYHEKKIDISWGSY